MPVENERGNENEINNTGKNKNKNKHTKKNYTRPHRAYIDEIVLLVQVNTFFMTGSLIEAINLLNSISFCVTHYQ